MCCAFIFVMIKSSKAFLFFLGGRDCFYGVSSLPSLICLTWKQCVECSPIIFIPGSQVPVNFYRASPLMWIYSSEWQTSNTVCYCRTVSFYMRYVCMYVCLCLTLWGFPGFSLMLLVGFNLNIYNIATNDYLCMTPENRRSIHLTVWCSCGFLQYI